MKKILSIVFVVILVFSLGCNAFAADGRDTRTIIVEEFSIDVNTLARNTGFEKTMYLYQTGELEDGTMVMAFSETAPAAAISIPVTLSAQQYQGRSYMVNVNVYSPLYLIKSFYVQVNYGDGDYSYGYATLSQITNGGAFAADYTIYHTYANSGTYTITIPSYVMTIYTDVYSSGATTTATISYSNFTVRVT